MDTSHIMVKMDGKSFLCKENVEQGALLTIVNKLQTDLSQMKYLSRNRNHPSEVISDTQLSSNNSGVNHSITSGSSSLHNPTNVDLKNRLKKNYEEKVSNLIKLYEKKLLELNEKVKYLEDDRESFAEALEIKYSTITSIKDQLQDLENQKNAELEELKKTHAEEVTKLRNELMISETCFKDLEQVRKYLERNNNLMKNEISETQANCEKKILNIAEEYENEKRKYKGEIKEIKMLIKEVEKQAQARINHLEENKESQESDYKDEIDGLQQEIAALKQQQKVDEEERQKLELEQKSYQDKLKHANIYYEAKINNLNVCAAKDREQYLEEVEAIKEKFEKQFTKLEEEYVALERDVELKTKEFLECETQKKQLNHEIVDVRMEFDLANKKHAEEYELLKQNFESAKKSYDNEHSKLKSILLDKEKIADDLDIANKKYEKQYTSLKNTIKNIKEEAEQDNEKMWEKLKSEKLFYQEEISKLNEEYSSWINKQEEEINRLKQENKENIEKMEQLETTKRTLEKSNRDLRIDMKNTITQYKNDIDVINRDNAAKFTEYEMRIEEVQTELSKLQKNVLEYEDRNRILQTMNDEYKTINTENSLKYGAEIERIRDEITLTKKFHSDDIISIQKQLELKEHLEKEKDERIQKLKQQITDIKSLQVTEVDEKVNKLEKVKKDLETENTIMKHRLNDLTEDLKIQKDKYENTQERMKQRCDAERKKMRDENENMVTTIDDLEKMVVDLERENKLLKKNLEDISKRQLDETNDLGEKLAFTQQKYDEKLHKLKQELELNRRNFENDLERARNEFQVDRQQYEEKIQELKIECNCRKTLNQELEAAKDELEKKWSLVQSDEYKKLAFLGTMGTMKFIEK